MFEFMELTGIKQMKTRRQSKESALLLRIKFLKKKTIFNCQSTNQAPVAKDGWFFTQYFLLLCHRSCKTRRYRLSQPKKKNVSKLIHQLCDFYCPKDVQTTYLKQLNYELASACVAWLATPYSILPTLS